MKISAEIRKLRQKGKIVYEYNPFKNFRIKTIPTHKYKLGEYRSAEDGEQATHIYDKEKEEFIRVEEGGTHVWVDAQYVEAETGATHYMTESGSYEEAAQGKLSDFDTELLNFDLEHPVEIECLPSYDGSVNLILDDGINPTRLINNRFTVKQNNTYEIIDRVGNSDTNLYDKDQFDLDSSLYKRINTIPKVNFLGLLHGGNLPVGNYNFYFKYTDIDGNETDFIAESGNVVCHIGNMDDPKSIRSGLENENSGKIVLFSITNLDTAYDYIKVYYSRQTSSAHNEPITEYKQLVKNFKTRGLTCLINITGFEETLPSSLLEINKEYFLAESAKSIALCKNRLFMANLSKPSIDYLDFLDVSLRMLPYYDEEEVLSLDKNYTGNKLGYYDVKNVYNKVGYWNEEIYRFGVVYILSDNSLSPVFNIRGCNEIPKLSNKTDSDYATLDFTDTNGIRQYLKYDEETCLIEGRKAELENNKGVIRIKNSWNNNAYSVNIFIPDDVKLYLINTLKVKGLFFVRQKRIPTILTQAFVIGHDAISGIPLIPLKETITLVLDDTLNDGEASEDEDAKIKYIFESFTDTEGNLTLNYEDRLVDTNVSQMCNNEIALCPDYDVRLELYNNFFTDTNFIIKKIANADLNLDLENQRHYYTNVINWDTTPQPYKTNSIIGIPDGTPIKRTKDAVFCAKAGTAENFDYISVGYDLKLDYGDDIQNKQFITRGNYGSYLGIPKYNGNQGDIINIYIPNYSTHRMSDYFTIRYEDQTPYYAASERLELEQLEQKSIKLYRGDCYICQYTHRLNRNFLDLTAPNNDVIVDESNWRTNYKPNSEPENLNNINIGDLNAVLMGSWITFTVRSNINLSIRDEDSSNISENLLTGNNRSFYPLSDMSVDGNYKIPESSIINTGISAWNSERANFTQPEVPYLKNCYQTRIAYSDISITDAFKNGYRTFLYDSYRDYPTTYGGIMKILEVKDSLLVVFEHGIGLAPVNERVMSGSGLGGNVFINVEKVLPETLNMITTDYGTQWSESVIQTPHGIYGVDTIAKKIWKYAGNQLELLSDDKVLKFLNDNITLTENDLTPIIGIRNVKTHYNAFKKDVMFTFYDCLEGYEEHAWNLCYNEYSGKFTTFYSWIPSYSANIDNIFFSFDRDTSKKIAKLDTTIKKGITVDDSILKKVNGDNKAIELDLNVELPEYYEIIWSTEPTLFDTHSLFSISNSPIYSHTETDGKYIKSNTKAKLNLNSTSETALTNLLEEHKAIPLNIKATVYEFDTPPTSLDTDSVVWGTYKKQLYFTKNDYIQLTTTNNPTKLQLDEAASKVLTTAFWKHGYGGIIDSQGKLEPCNWYGKLHPFEFEYVVNVNPDLLKTFDSMQIISNNVAPESFHYEIVGDTYDFSEDKLNMYVRQEMTKHLYQLNGSDITYNSNYKDLLIRVLQRNKCVYNKLETQLYGVLPNLWYGYKTKSEYKDKSTLFPTYYTRIDAFDEIYDDYVRATDPNVSKNYSQLSGGEIKYDPLLDQFSIVNHVQAIDVKNPIYGRLRGNIQYINDKWSVLINPLNFVLKNENWLNNKIPLNIRYANLIHDISSINPLNLPENYTTNDIDTSDWGNRKEAKLQDKYMKVKIRYLGDKLALITGVRTTFRV